MQSTPTLVAGVTAPGPVGVTVTVHLTVHLTVVDRLERSGERAVIDVRIELVGQPVATREHGAIVEALPARHP